MEESLRHAADLLAKRKSVVILTGAGISAESGVPTFREPQKGLWAKYDPMAMATPEAFEANPELVTRWYDWRRQELRKCEPNAGHFALEEICGMIRTRGGSVTLLTQNIDRLHQAAGSEDVIELHGNIWTWRCTLTGEERELPVPFEEIPVRSPAGGLYRPCVVWFGEVLPQGAIELAFTRSMESDLFVSIGTSGVVHPAAGLIELAKAHGAQAIEVNRDPTPVSGLVDVALQGPSGEVLPRVLDAMRTTEPGA